MRSYAGQGQRRDATRTFVASRHGLVIGYYTLVAGSVDHVGATPPVRQGLSRRFPIPICLLARLAVDQAEQGRGLGRGLLLDALRRALQASEQVAIRAVVVDAAEDRAIRFYSSFGFEAAVEDSSRLMVTLADVRAALGEG